MELIKPNTNINFVGNRYYAFALSGILLVLSVLSIPVVGKIQLGIDFTGGVMVQVKFTKDVHVDEIRAALDPLGENLIVQKTMSIGGPEEFIVRMEEPKEGSEKVGERVKTLLEEKLGKGTTEIRSVEIVGPKVGKDLRSAAVYATIIALAMLLVYMSFRFDMSMGLGAILCLIHDIIMVYGFFVWTGKEFNLTILAAVLTVVGYDINDTIIVCDRIRENLGIMRKRSLEEILNISINQTLSRTVLTSGFTLLVVVSLLIFGTTVLKDFAWALAIGIILGTYSSIFVAIPLVLAWDRLIPIKRRT
ncbi:MAG: protein translocase subunit SecF [Thermodesulfobacteriota bacterium]